ncbi:MAG TPA: MBL fold metallo-hydrolase [Candidatus Dormibacteraeota bacterium]|nr:MBL fold metallo-hydrolase [Candidatus Dormibacteraeota bacterium]
MPVEEVVPGLYSMLFSDWQVHVFYLIDKDEVTIIDTGGKGSAPGIIEGLRELGKGAGDVTRILLTHGHQDHAGSASRLAAATAAPVHVHAGDAQHVREGTDYPALTPRTLFGHMILRLQRPPRSVEATPVAAMISDRDEISGMRVVHTPGHSPGHVVLLWPRHGGVLVVGDALFNLPYLAPPPLYADLDSMWSSLRKISDLDFEVACFGHGKPIKDGASERLRKKFGHAPG